MMPTGYTGMIDRNPEMTTAQWIMQGLARAFGICVSLREDPLDLTEEQIKKRIVESEQQSVNYHEKELKQVIAISSVLAERTNSQWKGLWKADDRKRLKENAKSVTEANKMRERHEEIRRGLNKILASNKIHEVTESIAKFGIQQLDLVADDIVPNIREPMTLRAYITEAISSNRKDIEYHTKELAEGQKRRDERINLYARLKEDVKAVLKE